MRIRRSQGADRTAPSASARCTTAEALDRFDSLPAVTIPEMRGSWRGAGYPTGHRFDGLLERAGWHGKRFDDADDAEALVMDGRNGTYALDPRFVPMGLVLRIAPLAKNPLAARVLRGILPLLRTPRPTARLRMTEHRGVATATMTYDTQPIDDHFRRIDDDTLLGVMDMRGMTQPFFFVLRRSNPG
ncbi:DUF4334 domain-containing protein [Mobilicoccus massiliensis]|uniref:DUF4334 domain-containing protein n=1 Tax=Mobilicoccus massiliensis TaxID=1522310 RepID=UPI000693BF40|nr:DUF4334 domain-containing protein [Mobilicoccus massiliensis]